MQKEKLCGDDVNRVSVLQQILGENQSKCENNLGYCIKLDRNAEPAQTVEWCNDGASKENLHFDGWSKQVFFSFLRCGIF